MGEFVPIIPTSIDERLPLHLNINLTRLFKFSNLFSGLTGNYVFQVDGRRLGQLAHAIDDLMLRRFPALTAPPGTRVLPSSTTTADDDSLHLFKSAAIDIRSSGKPQFGVSPASSLSPPTGGAHGGIGIFGSASPQTGAAFAPSSLPTRSAVAPSSGVSGVEEAPLVPQHSSSSASSSTRSKKSSHRQLFGGGGKCLIYK